MDKCAHCGKPIERGQSVVYTMNRTPRLYWHAGDCYEQGLKPLYLGWPKKTTKS